MIIMNNSQRQGQELETVYPMDGIRLQPFLHQVSGRAIMMCLNEHTVCKPLNSREYCFYQSLPRAILRYTPQYKGVVNVNIEETKDGTIALTAFPPDDNGDDDDDDNTESEKSNSDEEEQNSNNAIDKNNNADSCKRVMMQVHSAGVRSSRKKIRLKRTGSLCIERADEGLDSGGELDKSSLGSRFNPWMLRVYKEGLKRHLDSKNKVVQKCILLENVTSRFKFPCILDLKMGTRVHGDFDDDAKRKRQLAKCARTTTQSLGVRLAGMQVYRHESGTFLCRNKYFGRGLSVDGFRKTLREFFYNGCKMRTDVINPIIENLKSLIDQLNKLPSYRFYSSSLLIMYDGAVENKEMQSDENGNPEVSESSLHQSELLMGNDNDSAYHEDDHVSNSVKPSEQSKENVDVRMIDFAKSTHRYMDESIIHKGPDKGYIFGLESLIQVLTGIVKELQ